MNKYRERERVLEISRNCGVMDHNLCPLKHAPVIQNRRIDFGKCRQVNSDLHDHENTHCKKKTS